MSMATKVLLEIWCDPGSKECGECNPYGCRLNPNENDCSCCGIYEACAAERAATGYRLRCQACLDAESAAKALCEPAGSITRQGVCGCGDGGFVWMDTEWRSEQDWWPVELLPKYCAMCGDRLNADGTATRQAVIGPELHKALLEAIDTLCDDDTPDGEIALRMSIALALQMDGTDLSPAEAADAD